MSLDELRQTLRQRAQTTEQNPGDPVTRQRLTEELTRMNDALGQRIAATRQNFGSATGGAGRSTGISIPGGTTIRRTETTTARYRPGGGTLIPPAGMQTPTTSSGSVTSLPERTTRATTTASEELHSHISQMLDPNGEARRRALLAMQREEAEDTANFTATGSGGPQTAFSRQTQPTTSNNLLGGNNLIYLLQDASGMPTALLVGPPGSAAQAPAPHIRWQPGLVMPAGADFGRIPHNLRGMAPEAANGLNHQDIFNAGGFGFEDPHGRPFHRQRNRGPLNIGEMLAGVRARATHFWLAVRLAVFVVLFTGSGGWRRMLYLGSIAVLIFSMLPSFVYFLARFMLTVRSSQSGKPVSSMNSSAPSQKPSTPLLQMPVSSLLPALPLPPPRITPTNPSSQTNP